MQEPGFPRPLPIGIQGRRWHPSDHIEYVERLRTLEVIDTTEAPDEDPPNQLPVMDVTEVVRTIDDRREGGHRAKAA
jgi:hypothetical protein